MIKWLYIILFVLISCNAQAQNYWSISLPLANYQVQKNIFQNNTIGLRYSELKVHEALAIQFIKSNKWGAQISLRTTNGERETIGLAQMQAQSSVNFINSSRTRVYSYDAYRYSELGYSQRTFAHHFSDIELQLFKAIKFKSTEFVFGVGVAKSLSNYLTTNTTTINYLKKDDKSHLYAISHRLQRTNLASSAIMGLELFEGKNFNLGLRAKLSTHEFNEQSVRMKRLSGLAPENEVVINEPSTYALYFGGQISFKYHLNIGSFKEGYNPLQSLRRVFFRY